MVAIYVLVGSAGLIFGWLALIATVALVRTEDLSRTQKIVQLLVAWCLPVVGALLVLRLLREYDPDSIPRKWIPNEAINQYIRELLGFEARAMNHVAKNAIETEITSTIEENISELGTGGSD